MNSQADYNAGVSVDEMIENMPAGLDRALLHGVLSFHVGRANAISRKQLLFDLGQLGFVFADDRIPRICINQLRKKGWQICSTGGRKGGYWMAEDQEEAEEFIKNEIEPRIVDLSEQARAMRAAAEKRWGRYSPAKQESFQL